jgi:hypothetical protein
VLARQGPEANILIGGADYASGDIVRDNYTYHAPGVRGPNLKIGYGSLENGDVIVERNYVVGGEPLIDVGAWAAARFAENTLIGEGRFIRLNVPVGVGHVVRGNAERRGETTTKVVVRHNPHEAGRGHIIVYNWGKHPTAAADVSGILRVGDRYEVRNVQDLFGGPVARGQYAGGSITIPLDGVTPPAPVGLRRSPAPQTGPAFDVFLLTRPTD